VGRPHGVRGDFFLSGRSSLLCLEPAAQYPARMGTCLTDSRAVTVTSHQVMQGRDLLHVQELSDRTDVETNAGASLWMETQLFSDPHAPWRNCTVFDATGETLGILREFVHHGATLNAQIESSTGDWLEVPFVENYFRFDIAQAKSRNQLHLTVNADILEDLWDRAPIETVDKKTSCSESP
jgi:ribosomal 30S subunit maturation factor RimM